MRSISHLDIVSAFDALDSTVSALLDMPFGTLTTPERLRLLHRLERVRRRLPAVEHGLINQLRQQASPTELGGSLTHGLANRLLITRAVPPAASTKPTTSASAERSPVNRYRRGWQ